MADNEELDLKFSPCGSNILLEKEREIELGKEVEQEEARLKNE
jgi:hypothetical protein